MLNFLKCLKFLFIIVPICCTSPTDINDLPDYFPLKIGNKSQFIILSDSSTVLHEIIKKVTRQDGQDVFMILDKYGTGANRIDTTYLFVKENYLVSTHLDTVSNDNTVNPYMEQRLGKNTISPVDSFPWIEGDKNYWKVDFLDSISTFAGTFKNICTFTSYIDSGRTIWGTTYYSNNIGHIGTAGSDMVPWAMCSYIKVGDKEYGNLWNEKDSDIGLYKQIFSKRLINQFCLLGQIK